MEKIRENLSDAVSCGLPLALEVMGERWSFMILRAAFNGICHFDEIQGELGIARNILSKRLTRMVENGIMQRIPCPDDRRRVQYCLTEKGADLLPVLIALRQWGEKYGTGVPSNPALVDARDRRPIGLVTIPAHDGRALAWGDLLWVDVADLPAD